MNTAPAPGTVLELYIWYETPASAAAAVKEAFVAIQKAVHLTWPNLPAPRLLQRDAHLAHAQKPPLCTWMEIWTALPQSELTAWRTAYLAMCRTQMPEPRHIEIFTAVSSSATRPHQEPGRFNTSQTRATPCN